MRARNYRLCRTLHSDATILDVSSANLTLGSCPCFHNPGTLASHQARMILDGNRTSGLKIAAGSANR
jgi:hypothetical protein